MEWDPTFGGEWVRSDKLVYRRVGVQSPQDEQSAQVRGGENGFLIRCEPGATPTRTAAATANVLCLDRPTPPKANYGRLAGTTLRSASLRSDPNKNHGRNDGDDEAQEIEFENAACSENIGDESSDDRAGESQQQCHDEAEILISWKD